MTRSIANRMLLILLGLLCTLCSPAQSDAALLDWLFPFRQQRLERRAERLNQRISRNKVNTSYYGSLPSYSRNPYGNWNGWSRIPTTANYQPVTAYRTVWTPVPVTNFTPTGSNALQSNNSYSWQARRVPYVAYQPSCWGNASTAATAGTTNPTWQSLARPTIVTGQYASGFGQGVVASSDEGWSSPFNAGINPQPSTCQACAPGAQIAPADTQPRLSTGFAPRTDAYASSPAGATPWVPVTPAITSRDASRLEPVPADEPPVIPRASQESYEWQTLDPQSDGSSSRASDANRAMSYQRPATKEEYQRESDWRKLDQAPDKDVLPTRLDRSDSTPQSADWQRLGRNDQFRRSRRTENEQQFVRKQPMELPSIPSTQPARPRPFPVPQEKFVSNRELSTRDVAPAKAGWYAERSNARPRYLPPRHLQQPKRTTTYSQANTRRDNPIRSMSQQDKASYDWRADRRNRDYPELQPIPSYPNREQWQESSHEDDRTASLITFTRWRAKPASRDTRRPSDDGWYSAAE